MATLINRWSVVLVCVLAGPAAAQPEPWVHPDGTIHYYRAVAAPDGITWHAAFDSAQTPGGYLATLTSQAENDFVFELVDTSDYWYQRPGSGALAGPWLGAHRGGNSPFPDSGWQWITQESLIYRNWSPREPDNQTGNERALHFGESVAVRIPTWDDLDETEDSIPGFVIELSADSTTIGLLQSDSNSYAGYTLFAPLRSPMTYLIDNKGRLVHFWHSSYVPGLSVHLLENGDLLHTARLDNPVFPSSAGGRVEELDWDGNLVWGFTYSDTLRCQHHDALKLPGRNVLLVAWEYKTLDEALAAGRDPALLPRGELWPDHVVEVDPTSDSIVWEWHVWDHLVQDYDSTKQNFGAVADHPELVDLNYVQSGAADWLHVNSLDYNEQYDQIMLSTPYLNEVWVIDHSTTTEQARGHAGGRQGMGGDILYRWGNPQTYRAGTGADRRFFGQHNAQWIGAGLPGAGHIMVYNNGLDRPEGNYSTVDEFIPTSDSTGHYPRPLPGTPHGPAMQCWVYAASPAASFYSVNISGAQRLPNGNTVICEGIDGRFFEVTRDSQVVWRYLNPVIDSVPLHQGDTFPGGGVNSVFRAPRYSPTYPGLAGRDLTPGYPLELYATPALNIGEGDPSLKRPVSALAVTPNPCSRQATVSYTLPRASRVALSVYTSAGRLVRTLVRGSQSSGYHEAPVSARSLPPGIYLVRLGIGADGLSLTKKLVKSD